MATKRDYYQVLGVERKADAETIKRAYRRLARKHHPDANRNEANSGEKFKEVQEAYDILSEPAKRAKYDEFGHDGVASAYNAAADPRRGSYQHPGARQPAEAHYEQVDMNDILGSMFGRRGGRNPFAGMSQEEPAGEDLIHHINLSFEQAIRGAEVDISLRAPIGAKLETLSVKIPAGVDENSKVRLRGKGQPSTRGGPRGDLIIVTHVVPHPYFTRDGIDIFLDLPISMSEAATGATIAVPTLDGMVDLKLPAGITSGKKLRIRGKGVANKDVQGDQYVRLHIMLPPNLTATEKARLAEIDAAHHFNPRAEQAWKTT